MALVLSVVLGLARPAASTPESVRIDYVVPAGCPDAAAFERALRERTTRFRQAAPGEQVRTLSVRVMATASSFAGRLEVRGLDGSSAVRGVEGQVCGEVTSALALMTALAIDPNALTGASPKAPAGGSKPTSGGPDGPAPKAPVGPERQPSPAALDAAASASSSAASRVSQPWRWSAGLLGRMTFGLWPTSGYGGDLFLETEAPASSRLGPAVRAGILVARCEADLAAPTGAAAEFQVTAAALEGCPARIGLLGDRLVTYPCLAFRLGVLRSEGSRISQPRRTVGLWSEVEPVLRVRLAATTRVRLEAQASLIVPLTRPVFDVLDAGSQTTTASYAVPRLGGSAGIGASYQFR